MIRDSGRYVGYDSAAGHVAAACGVPLISIFKGAVCERMFERWKPSGTVMRADNADPEMIIRDVVATLTSI